MSHVTRWIARGAAAALLVAGFASAQAAMVDPAQDPVNVGPDIYKVILENERVRVSEVTFKPGARIGMHSHPDHLAYILSEGTLQLSYPDGRTQDINAKPGQIMWTKAESHAAKNLGQTEARLLVVELKEPAPSTAATVH